MRTHAFVQLAAASLALGAKLPLIKNLVTFGDSYSDVVNIWDGGVPWPRYVASYANLTLYPFARSGATCSNNITYRPSPPVMESQIPDYQAANLSASINQKETLYTLWIGTNDVGIGSLITGGAPGKTVVDTTRCAVNWVRVMYGLGARNFLFMNMIPLHLTPMYGVQGYPMKFWTTPHDPVSWALFMEEVTNAGNALGKYMLEDVAKELKGAHVGLFDAYSLFEAMWTTPEKYLNGTVPYNVTGSITSCVYEPNGGPVGGACPPPISDPAAKDSYLWWDELHPSEQADRIIAREIVRSIRPSGSTWTTWLS
ncbi:GDSL lipase/acylhydrolase [Auriculariales sp. MPI-PUGE-AT-0066]|nr:GDSL lipase/acylhydrolase [Auriculariales sp. MPI-PUGE-AT-0066]